MFHYIVCQNYVELNIIYFSRLILLVTYCYNGMLVMVCDRVVLTCNVLHVDLFGTTTMNIK